MTKRMLIDATHAEETRVVVLDGNRLEDFDVETSTKRQLKGNIYLAKVVRVEPSLQAAFVEYGGNRHGFLAFSEIHPDYYQIPVADRQRLIEQEAEEAQREEEEADREIAAGTETWTPPASRGRSAPSAREHSSTAPRAVTGADMAQVETGDESGATTEMLREPAGEVAPAQAEGAHAAPAATGDESGATVDMLREAPVGAASSAAAPHESADVAPAEAGDESGATVEMLRDTAAAELGDSIGGAAAAGHAGAGSEPGDGVSGAVAVTPAESAAPPAVVSLAPVAVIAAELADAAAASPPPAAASAEASEPASQEHPPSEAAATHAAEQSPSGSAASNTAPAAEAPADAPGGDHNSAASTAPESGAPTHADPGHDDEPTASSHRAQPMVITQDTLSGPVESAGADDGPDTDVLERQAEMASEADTEEEPDLTDDYGFSVPETPPPETVGGEADSAYEHRERRPPSRYLRNYKIQEVIRRRQILLVQVVKEERGTKGAALTTYLSLAGRFSVLMPNSPRGGGISRKITSASDRRRLKEVISELEMPKGMGMIIRTAGANRPKPEIKRDCEYLLRLWDDIREHTLKSVAPALIYEEASLIKRAIRDVYSRDIDEILVDGEDGWRAAHEFMRMLMPSHAKKVQLWRDPTQPLFTKHQVEAQLDAMLEPTVQLRSGGYLVINQAEALVAIDVNSGRSTRERNVEETALRTNLEAADEVARALRLRDLAGLIVIDFIDMEQKKHNAMVERRLKEALKNDRARIQVGHISHFGLLEMSRQRLRPSLAEASFILCPHCGGTGHVRSTENAAIHVLRGIEDEGSKRRAAEIVVHVAMPIALYILNHKRDRLREIELRYAMRVTVMGDDTQVASQFRIDRMRPQVAREDMQAAITPDQPQPAPRYEPEEEEAEAAAVEDEADLEEAVRDAVDVDESGDDEADGSAEAGGTSGRSSGTEGTAAEQAERRRRRRRRRRGGRREEGPQLVMPETVPAAVQSEMEQGAAEYEAPSEAAAAAAPAAAAATDTHIEGVPEHVEAPAEDDARPRRGRRGGRRRRREPGDAETSPFAAPGAEQPDLPPVYIGPTPANPFGGHAFDIFDVLEQVEASAAIRQEPALRQQAPESSTGTEPGMPQPKPELHAVIETTEPRAVAEAADQQVPPQTGTVTQAMPETASPSEMAMPEVASAREPMPGPLFQDAAAEPASARTLAAPSTPDRVSEPTEPVVTVTPELQEIVNAAAPEPLPADTLREPAQAEATPANAARTESTHADTAEPAVVVPQEAAPAEVANDPASEPAIRPIIIGSDAAPAAEKKRGWWRR